MTRTIRLVASEFKDAATWGNVIWQFDETWNAAHFSEIHVQVVDLETFPAE